MTTVSKLEIVLEATTTAFDNGLKKAQANLKGFAKKTDEIHSKMDKFARRNKSALGALQNAGAAAAIGLGAGVAGIKDAITAAVDFEKAMAGVKKVVDFETPMQFKQMERDIIALSQRLPMTAVDIAAIMEAAAQSNIAREELSRFAESAVKMGVAFDVSAEEAGKAMAELRASFKMTQTEVETLADQINYLSSNSTNSASSILEVVQRIGSVAQTAKVSAASISALSASLVGVAPDVAATGLKNFLLTLTKGEQLSKSAKAAFKTMGLDYNAVAKGMVEDSEATIRMVLQAAQKVPEHLRLATLSAAYGSESVAVIAQLVTGYETVDKHLVAMGDSAAYSGSMLKEFESQAGTSAAQMQLFDNNVQAMKIAFGSAFLPALNEAMSALTPLIQSVTKWAQQNPELVASITKVAAGALGAVAALGGLALAFTSVTGGIGALLSIGSMVSGFFSVISSGVGVVKMFGVALAALGFPVTAVVAAITALVAGGVALYMNWDTVKAKAIEVWNAIPEYASQAWQWISGVWSGIGEWFGGIWDGIKSAVMNKLAEVKQAFAVWLRGMPEPVREMVKNIGDFFNGLVTVVSAIWSAITAVAKLAFSAVVAIWKGLSSAVSSAWQAIVGVAANIWNAVKAQVILALDKIKPIISSITSFFLVAWNGLVDAAGRVWNAIKAVVSLQIAAMKATIKAGVTVFASIFNAGFNLVKTVISTVFNVIKALVKGDMNGVKDAIKNGFKQAQDIVKTAVKDIANAFKTLGKDLMQAGKDAIQGFINGVKSKLSAAKTAITEFASSIPQTVKSVLKIFSPSRRMKALGKDTADGFTLGIQAGTAKSTKAAQKMAEDAAKAVQDTLNSAKRDYLVQYYTMQGNELPELYADKTLGKFGKHDISEIEKYQRDAIRASADFKMDQDIKQVQAQIDTLGMSTAQLLDYQYDKTNKYKHVHRDLFELYKAETLELERQTKLYQKLVSDADALTAKRADLDKRKFLYGNQDSAAELAYDLRDNDDRLGVEYLLNETRKQNATERFGALQSSLSLAKESPAEKLKREYDEQLAVITDYEKRIGHFTQDSWNARADAFKAFKDKEKALEVQAYEEKSALWTQAANLASSVWNDMTETVKKAFGEQSVAAKMMFAGQKAIAIAQAIINTELAATKAMAEGGMIAGIPMATAIRAAGYTSVGLMAAQTISGLVGQAHDGIMSVPKSGTWNLEKGERVLPKHTAKALDAKLDSIGNGAPKVIINNYSGEKASAEPQADGSLLVTIGQIIDTKINQRFNSERRQGGMMYGR